MDLIFFPEQIDEIAAGAAAGVKNPAAGGNTSSKQLIKEVDIDVTELFLQIGHVTLPCYENGKADVNCDEVRQSTVGGALAVTGVASGGLD